MELKLIPDTDSRLKTECEKFDFSNPPVDPAELAEALCSAMQRHGGIGLAANQVGLNYRVFALATDPFYVCFNPRVVNVSDEIVELEEGCLTFPGLFLKVKRPKSIRVRFQGPNGDTFTQQFTGMTARAFLHEMDHLDGKVFFDRIHKIHRDSAMNKWRKLKRKAA